MFYQVIGVGYCVKLAFCIAILKNQKGGKRHSSFNQ